VDAKRDPRTGPAIPVLLNMCIVDGKKSKNRQRYTKIEGTLEMSSRQTEGHSGPSYFVLHEQLGAREWFRAVGSGMVQYRRI
jgi:hypothetical protein